MATYSLFAAPVLGMTSQSHALNVIGVNIANINTGGFKASETRFSTLVSKQFDNNKDMGGVKPQDFQRIVNQGVLVSSDRDLDVAINGRGFFVLNSLIDGTGQTRYGRDGSFEVGLGDQTSATAPDGSTITVREGYLVDKNGFFVQGLVPDTNGNFSIIGSLQSLRIDQFAFSEVGEATSTATIGLNLPAKDAFADIERFSAEVFDSAGASQSVNLNFQKGDFTVVPPLTTPNLWSLSFTTDAATTAPVLLTFDSKGQLQTPTTTTAALTFSSGATASVAFDLSDMTQFAGEFTPVSFEKNGFAASEIRRLQFDREGNIIGSFGDGTIRKIYKVPLAVFSNPNGLLEKNGNTFVETEDSGERLTVAAGTGGFALFAVNSLERSNVDLSGEFSRMILAQNAYNMSATSFRTIDEMTEVARDLKR